MLLPWDIIVDILTRLPAKSLLRFRCVSKKFLSLIDGKDFIYRNVNRSIETNSNLNLIVSLSMWKPGNRIYSLSLDFRENCVELDSRENCVEIAREFREYTFDVIGSCNGLLALQNKGKGIILLNPSTKEHLELPEFYYDNAELCCDYLFGGFGFDVGSDDYKLVKIAVFGVPVRHAVVIVYSLKNNSSRKITDFPYHFWLNIRSGAFVNGALHWLAHLSPECFRDDLMIAFDLKSEEFYQVPMPLTVGNGGLFNGVYVLGGCLSLTYLNTEMLWDIFVMKDYGVKDSWTKLFTLIDGVIDYTCDHVKALASSKNRKKVLFVCCRGNLFWYDIEKRMVESGIGIDVQEMGGGNNGIVCVDSLVSIEAYRHLYW